MHYQSHVPLQAVVIIIQLVSRSTITDLLSFSATSRVWLWCVWARCACEAAHYEWLTYLGGRVIVDTARVMNYWHSKRTLSYPCWGKVSLMAMIVYVCGLFDRRIKLGHCWCRYLCRLLLYVNTMIRAQSDKNNKRLNFTVHKVTRVRIVLNSGAPGKTPLISRVTHPLKKHHCRYLCSYQAWPCVSVEPLSDWSGISSTPLLIQSGNWLDSGWSLSGINMPSIKQLHFTHTAHSRITLAVF